MGFRYGCYRGRTSFRGLKQPFDFSEAAVVVSIVVVEIVFVVVSIVVAIVVEHALLL